MPAKVIETARLRLRQLVMADAADIARLIGDFEVSRWLTVVPHPYTVEDAKSYLRKPAPDWRFGIEMGGKITGAVSIDNRLGYWLGKPYWGYGYMSEAVQAIITEWFSDGGGTIKSGYFVENRRSGSVLCNLGFRYAAVVQEHSLAQGIDVALQKMILTRQDWLTRDG